MKAEIIAVGTELLVGQIANTNAQYLSQGLNGIGVDVYFHTVVGDNPFRMTEALRIAAGRADTVILTGGLGPTQDDLTKRTVADFVGREIVMHQPALEAITAYFTQRKRVMSDNNARQAETIEGGDILPNDNGMAIGVALTYDGTHFILLPGPPSEMKPMFDSYVLPWLGSRIPQQNQLFSTTLKFSGIGESSLEDTLKDLIAEQTDPTIAPYAKDGEVTLRVSTKARDLQEADRKMAGTIGEIESRLGEYIFAKFEISLEEAVMRLLRDHGLTLSVAESCTGGLLGEMITAIAGSSSVFDGGIISYSAAAKENLLGVSEETIRQFGTVSTNTAEEMALGCLGRFGSDWAIAVTGVAGPEETEGKPVGTVYLALASKAGWRQTYPLNLSGNRGTVRLRAVKSALYQLWRQLR